MNTFLQIAIALSPILLLFVILSVFAKKGRVINIVTASIVGCAVVGSVICNFAIEPDRMIVDDDDTIAVEKTVEQIDIIYSIAAETGDYDYALKLLKELRANSYDSANLSLCEAYLNAAKGNWKNAIVLYNKSTAVSGEYNPEFSRLLDLIVEESKIDYAALEYTNDTAVPSQNGIDQLKEYTRNAIAQKASKVSSELVSVAGVLTKSNEVFNNYLTDGTFDKNVAVSLCESMVKSISKNNGLLKMNEVRICRAKLMVLSGKYSDFAKTIADDSIYEELSIASELCIGGFIRDSHFADRYESDYKNKVSLVCNYLNELCYELSGEEKEQVKALIDKLKSEINPTAIDILEDTITAKTLDDDFSDKPKAFIQLAKISYKKHEKSKAKNHISSALNSLGVSDDEEFYVPLGEIARVINDKDNRNDLKNVASYVDEVLNNSSDKVVIAAVEEAKKQAIDSIPNGGTVDVPQQQDKVSFDTFMGDVVSQLRVSVNITNVNVEKFSQVTATVNIDDSISLTAEELKNMITLQDCGINITDFTVEKVEYKAANILLCCDVSGSMSGKPLNDLKEAVKKFIQTSSDKENIALVTFDSRVLDVYEFGTDKNTIINAVDGLRDSGGTNMYGAVIDSIKKFSVNEGELNFILLLSDGADNHSHSTADINKNIGEACMDKQIILYSLGLGDSVNIDYMDELASSTNGAFVYVADSGTVEEFYDNLRSQLLNQYYITYTAKDTLTYERTLKIYVTEDPLSQDTATYYLGEKEEGTENENNDPILTFGEKGIYGLNTGLIYKSNLATTVSIKGFGFEDSDTFTAELYGKLNYGSENIKCQYVDGNTISMTLPGGIACGKYDVRISVGDLTANIQDGIMVVTQGSEKTVAFGPYVFTAYEKTETNGLTTLSGYVTLNGWLSFNGDVILKRGLDNKQMILTDTYGSRVSYYSDSAKGIAKLMADKNVKLPLPPLGNITLFNDSLIDAESDDYPVLPVSIGFFYVTDMLACEAPGVSLYPNRIKLKSNEFTSRFPLQDKILKSSGYKNIFNFKVEIEGIITNKTIGIKGSYSNKPEDTNVYNPVNLGAKPIYLSPATYTIEIDTVANEYSIDFDIKVAFIKAEGLGFYVQWKERTSDSGYQKLWPHEVLIKADIPIKTTIGPVPVTFGDFKLGVSDIDPNKHILDWKLKGAFTLGTSKVSEIVPGLEEYIDDPSILSLEDTTIEFSWGQCYFGISTEMKLLEEITLGTAKIEAGKISVTSVLLGFEDQRANGMRAEISRKIKWDRNNVDFEANGTGIIHLHDQFVGVELQADLNVDIKWYIFKVAKFSERGFGAIGFQFDRDLPTFVIKVATSDSVGNNGYYLIWNKRTGVDCGKLEL